MTIVEIAEAGVSELAAQVSRCFLDGWQSDEIARRYGLTAVDVASLVARRRRELAADGVLPLAGETCARCGAAPIDVADPCLFHEDDCSLDDRGLCFCDTSQSLCRACCRVCNPAEIDTTDEAATGLLDPT